jgi:hypothetical protein
MAKFLEVDRSKLIKPLHRLNIRGVFTKRYNLRNDHATSGEALFKTIRYKRNNQVSEINFSPLDAATNAFCILAGISGGLT